MRRTTILTILMFLAVLFAGCEGLIRLEPSQAQKQTAALTHQVALEVDAKGAQPASIETQRLVKGTLANSLYIGLPTLQPDTIDFDSIVQDAQEKPTNDKASIALEIGLIIASLFGGGAVAKIAVFLKNAKANKDALKEIVLGGEIFKQKASTDAVQAFKDAQIQTSATASIVAAIKSTPAVQAAVVNS
jgi:hypothetical protein